uniref:Tetraspanin n=1 Tax=Echinococcus granulosus TaxID=6210 RepID=A0A068WJW3_ECHGR|nr:tetraspanin [Echinococcus granulosus]
MYVSQHTCTHVRTHARISIPHVVVFVTCLFSAVLLPSDLVSRHEPLHSSTVLAHSCSSPHLPRFLLGLVLLGIGMFFFFENCRTHCTLLQIVLPLALMTFGGVTIVTTSLGYIGALVVNLCAIRLFIVLITLVFLGQLTAGLTLHNIREDLVSAASKEIRQLIAEAENALKSEADLILEKIQTRYKCCGADGQSDWEQGPPLSCCVNPKLLEGVCSYPGMYVRGCASAMYMYLESNMYIWLYMVIALLVVEFTIIIASYSLQMYVPIYSALRTD